MSRGVTEFESARLRQALAARRLTQAQLAGLVGVSPATISKWRSGSQAPEADALERLAQVMNVTAEWFTRKRLPKSTMPLYRSNASAHVAAREMLGARLEWAEDVAFAMTSYVDFPALRLPTFDFVDLEAIADSDIEDAATRCRHLWGLGTAVIPDLALAVESAGIVLVREETGVAQIEGLSAWSATLERPFVLLSADKANAFRSRFDLAHELGHLILHRHICRAEEKERHTLLERQAHRFAGAFLLPAESIAMDVRTPVTLDSLLLLKQRWGVSVAAIIMRLVAIGVLSEDDKQLLFKRRSARWGVKAEPGDELWKPEQPRLLRRTVELLISSKLVPREFLPKHFGLGQRDVEMLCALPDGYFSHSGEVIQLAQLRSGKPTVGTQAGSGTVLPFSRNLR
ncbi:XRE family transcriptional regulator [Cupriavidus oxalaticus]|uniref:XRE family transcriptional regulator n=1 Tax=Cupriavidus oxalaticus TaxID=96344 RepID=UPI00317CBC1E